jgi:transposase
MKKEIVRKEAIKEKLKGKSYTEVIQFLKERFEYSVTKVTLINWMKRFYQTDWDFRDTSQRPKTIHYKFTKEHQKEVVKSRKKRGYSANKLRVQLREKNIFMSESTIKRIVKYYGLSNGNKMEGIKLK